MPRFNIVPIGRTGSGKSLLGNYLLGKEAFAVGHRTYSCTKQPSYVIGEIRNNSGMKVGVMDPSGLRDSDGEDEKLGTALIAALKELKDGVHCLLLVFKFNDRLDEDFTKNLLPRLLHMFPDRGYWHQNLAVALTNRGNDSDVVDDKCREWADSVHRLVKAQTGWQIEQPFVFAVDPKDRPADSASNKAEVGRFTVWLQERKCMSTNALRPPPPLDCQHPVQNVVHQAMQRSDRVCYAHHGKYRGIGALLPFIGPVVATVNPGGYECCDGFGDQCKAHTHEELRCVHCCGAPGSPGCHAQCLKCLKTWRIR